LPILAAVRGLTEKGGHGFRDDLRDRGDEGGPGAAREVATYGEIAAEAGFPGAARAVGNVLARSEGLAWWRVVRADGGLVRSHEKEQARRLRREGVRVVGGRVVATEGRGPGRARGE
jgi:alkylated DNA nucleotide flippase Atl1